MPEQTKRVGIVLLSLIGVSTILRFTFEKGQDIVWMNAHHTAFLDKFFVHATTLGEAPMFWLAIGILLFVKYRYAITIALGGLLTLAFTGSLKELFGQPRPLTWFTEAGTQHLLVVTPEVELYHAFNSFPSGHTLSAFVLYILLAQITRKWWLQCVWIFIAATVGVSRIYLQHHFLEDVIFGAFCGSLIAVSLFIAQRIFLKHFPVLDQSLVDLIQKLHV